ncbi:MAG TPA: hypothetical protein DET40_01565 [Lentisphaeria bacterium]|nr:MAG: hypothetical protein A2X45_17155 [Lentisphaerae bacterium GWF2_50_93]HCE42221.1 hypothetical protein [Lentisphaeria bacterium]
MKVKTKRNLDAPLKTEALKFVSMKSTVDDIKGKNLQKILRSGILENFIWRENGSWDHHGWINLCEEISLNDVNPVDFDQVGMILETVKEIYNRIEADGRCHAAK